MGTLSTRAISPSIFVQYNFLDMIPKMVEKLDGLADMIPKMVEKLDGLAVGIWEPSTGTLAA